VTAQHDGSRVPIRTSLTGPAFIRFERAAASANTTVAVLVAHVAETVGPLSVTRRRYVRLTAEQWSEVEQMLAQGVPVTRVATQFGVNRETIARHRKARS
jgi:DNA invertase Pin-like site-specific DNA recombinase